MIDAEFERYLSDRNLAERTRTQRVYALKRIERAHSVDLDTEFERDNLESLLKKFSYSTQDARNQRPNPSKLDIDLDKLLTHLAWYRSHLTAYFRFRSGDTGYTTSQPETDLSGPSLVEELVEDAVGKTFALERDLQLALRANISQLEAGLEIVDGGAEKRVEAGFIDILARDRTGVLTVIELKSEIARPDSVAQILAYMGCVAEETQQSVRGILVAGDHHQRVVYAARAIPNLSLKKYRFKFEFD